MNHQPNQPVFHEVLTIPALVFVLMANEMARQGESLGCFGKSPRDPISSPKLRMVNHGT